MTLDQVADGSNGRFSKAALSSIERGTADIDDSSLAELAAMYGLATSSLIPERSLLELDVAEGVLRTQIRVEAVGDALDPSRRGAVSIPGHGVFDATRRAGIQGLAPS